VLSVFVVRVDERVSLAEIISHSLELLVLEPSLASNPYPDEIAGQKSDDHGRPVAHNRESYTRLGTSAIAWGELVSLADVPAATRGIRELSGFGGNRRGNRLVSLENLAAGK
jgi:hypothetical protein